MRVGFSILTLFPGRAGGAETYVRGLLGEYGEGRGPAALSVLANRRVLAAYKNAGVELREVRNYRSGNSDLSRVLAMNLGRLWPVVAPGEFDVLHYAVTVPIPRVRETPTVVTLFDVQHHERRSSFSDAQRWLRRWAYDDAARGADRVITISEHAKAGIVGHLGVPEARVQVIPLGVDHALFAPDGPPPEGLPERYIFYPANLWPHKNHELLVAAFEKVADNTLHLVLTGQFYGNEGKFGDRQRVHVLGHVPAERLPAIYRGAMAMVFPSLFEGFGLPVLEAMACGTAVACTNGGALTEVAGAAALGFDATDVDAIAQAIGRITSDEHLRTRLRAAGLVRARGFTWSACAAQHLEAYEIASHNARDAP